MRTRRPDIPPSVLASLRDEAKRAAEYNYARYSGVLVVAAVETAGGAVFGGTNIEVANYALGKHAEEVAIIRALASLQLRESRGRADRWLKTLYICGAAPCGSCRQFAWEWATPRARCVIDLPSEGRYRVLPLREMLPEPFGSDDIGDDRRPARPIGGQLPP